MAYDHLKTVLLQKRSDLLFCQIKFTMLMIAVPEIVAGDAQVSQDTYRLFHSLNEKLLRAFDVRLKKINSGNVMLSDERIQRSCAYCKCC